MPAKKYPYDDNAVIIEFLQIGKSVRVSAMEPRSLTEVTIIGSSSTGEEELTRVVLRKLDYVMAKQGLK